MKVNVVALILKAIGQRNANLAFDAIVDRTQTEKVALVLKRKVCIANAFIYDAYIFSSPMD